MTDTSPADQIRRAANVLRRNAEAAHRASPAPWKITNEQVIRSADGMIVADRSGTDHPAERADLPYIEAVHPGVGEHLADWLDSAAEDAEQIGADPRAVATALALLGRPAPEPGQTAPRGPHSPSGTPVGAATLERAADGRTAVPLPDFIEIAKYRHDHGHQAWAGRCWGNGTCDGWLSLDHRTEQGAQRWARRHLTEDHPDSRAGGIVHGFDRIGETGPDCGPLPRRTTPDSTVDSQDNQQDNQDSAPGHDPLTRADTVRTGQDTGLDDALREQYAEALHAAGGPFQTTTAEDLADAVLAVRDRRMAQLAAGRQTWQQKAHEMEAALVMQEGVSADLRVESAARKDKLDRARAECHTIQAETYTDPSEDANGHRAAVRRILAALDEPTAKPHPAEAERDGAYRERAHLLAWLAALHPANAVITSAADIDEDRWQLLYLLVGGWQMSWHIHPRDEQLFAHVERVDPDDSRAQWDGHSTTEKYKRLQKHVARLSGASAHAAQASG